MERISFIDGLKGYAIILVVIGHVITYTSPSDFSRSWLFSFIYSFHMPLFLFLSGFLVYLYPPGRVYSFILKKMKVLVYPYFLWLFIFAIAAGGIVLNRNIISNFALMVKSYSLWFLPALFISLLVLICYRHVEHHFAGAGKTEVAGPALFLILYLLAWVVPISFSLFLILRWFSPFVLLGYLAAKHWQRITEIEYLMPVSALIFVLLLPSWGGYSVSFTIGNNYTPPIDFVLAVAGIGLAFLLIASLRKTKLCWFLQI
jgi:fucose 4-O-acetylase-like acetyltransferase